MEYQVDLSAMSQFGNRERTMTEELLAAMWQGGLPEGFRDAELEIRMSTDSGDVFLMNKDHQVAMMNDLNLEEWFICPSCEAEGFADDIGWDASAGLCGDCADEDEDE